LFSFSFSFSCSFSFSFSFWLAAPFWSSWQNGYGIIHSLYTQLQLHWHVWVRHVCNWIQFKMHLYCKQLDMLWSEIPFTPPQMRVFKSAAVMFVKIY
jgi:hypothetical protein